MGLITRIMKMSMSVESSEQEESAKPTKTSVVGLRNQLLTPRVERDITVIFMKMSQRNQDKKDCKNRLTWKIEERRWKRERRPEKKERRRWRREKELKRREIEP